MNVKCWNCGQSLSAEPEMQGTAVTCSHCGAKLNVAEEFRQPEASLQTQLNESADAAPKKSSNYFARHWRGELSLGVSYWVDGILGTLLITAATGALAGLADVIDLNVTAILTVLVLNGAERPSAGTLEMGLPPFGAGAGAGAKDLPPASAPLCKWYCPVHHCLAQLGIHKTLLIYRSQ